MPSDREMFPDGLAPAEQQDAPVSPLADEPAVDTGYDPGNPWWAFCRDWQVQMDAIREQRRQHWDSLSDEQKEACRLFVHEQRKFIRDIKDTAPKMIEAQAETNRFILRALEKERLDREARARGEASPCSLDVDAANAVARELQ